MRVFYKGFNFGQDGPGNRLVYHIAGCNMHCPWCSNPEGMKIDNDYTVYTPNDLVREAISCKPMFFGDGGVTFTGGEATLDYRDLLLTLKTLKENKIHTALETNGTSMHLEDLLPFIDYLIMDFKHYNSDTLKRYTGVDSEQIKRNYENICKSGRQYHIRIPLIKHFNAEHPECFAEYFSKFPTEHTVFEFLKYHEYGKEKWKEEYKITDGFVTDETVKNFKKVFEKFGLRCVTT